MAACQPPVWVSCRIPCGFYQTVMSTQFVRTLEQQIKQTERYMAAIDQVARPFDPRSWTHNCGSRCGLRPA